METFIIAALSTDGFIAQQRDQASTDWTSAEDRQFFQKMTKAARVVVMGRTTFETLGRPLPGRLNVVYTSQDREDFLESQGLQDQNYSTDVLQVANSSPISVVEKLKVQGFDQVAVCGGSSIYTQFMQAGLVDKLYLTVEPVLFGDGVKLFNRPIEQHLILSGHSYLNKQNTLLLEYEVN